MRKIHPQEIILQGLFNEYNNLQQEAMSNHRQRYILVSLNIAAIGTLITLSITTTMSSLFIVVISIVTSAL